MKLNPCSLDPLIILNKIETTLKKKRNKFTFCLALNSNEDIFISAFLNSAFNDWISPADDFLNLSISLFALND